MSLLIKGGVTRPISPPLELTELVAAVCSETEAAGLITAHGEGAKHRWTLDKLLKGAGAGANPTEIDVPAASSVSLSDILAASLDTERTSVNDDYEKLKEFTLGIKGTLRIKFDLRSSHVEPSRTYGKIYRNGEAVGTEQSAANAWETKTEDIAGWLVGDTCELWAHRCVGLGTVFVRNFQLFGSWSELTLD